MINLTKQNASRLIDNIIWYNTRQNIVYCNIGNNIVGSHGKV